MKGRSLLEQRYSEGNDTGSDEPSRQMDSHVRIRFASGVEVWGERHRGDDIGSDEPSRPMDSHVKIRFASGVEVWGGEQHRGGRHRF
jgi:hypothetical protein